MTEAHADSAIPADDLAAVVAPLLVDNVMAIEPGAPVGGSRRCQASGCWRSQTSGALCGTHHVRWNRAGKPAIDTPWDTGPELTSSGRLEPHMVDLGVLPAPLRWEIAFGIEASWDWWRP